MHAPKAYVCLSAIVAALGGLLFGFDTAVISGTTDSLERVFGLGDVGRGFAVSSALFGTIAGCLFAGFAADRFGRRASLIIIALMYFVSAIGSALSPEIVSFVAFRALGGIGVGASSVIAAMYIAEISPARSRGLLVGIFQMNIVIGILVAFLSNYLIAQHGAGVAEAGVVDPNDTAAIDAARQLWQDETGWRVMLGTEAVPAVVFFVLLFLTPRSPRWLMAQGREEEARRVLAKVGTDDGDLEKELGAIRESLASTQSMAAEPLFRKKYSRPIFLVLLLATFNQLSGINAVLYYAPTIFRSAGASEEAMFLFPVWLGVANLLFTILGLALIDRLGRRFLLLIGSVGYIASLGTAAAAFALYGPDFTGASTVVVLVALAVFIASHAVGQGAVIWVYIGEIFPNVVRAKGQSLGCLTHWVWAAGLTFAFPVLLSAMGGAGVFALFALCMTLQLVWVVRAVPETKGISLEEIEHKLGVRSPH